MATRVSCRMKPGPAIGRGQAAERPGRGAATGQLERDSGASRSTPARVLIEVWIATSSAVPLRSEAAGAHVEVLVVLADDDHVDVVGPLAADRALDAREEVDRTEVDVLVEVEPQPQQDSLLQHARGHLGVADGAEQDRIASRGAAGRPRRGGPRRSSGSARRRCRTCVELVGDPLGPRDDGEHFAGSRRSPRARPRPPPRRRA